MADHKIKAVVFDWAGTMIDHGCFGPVAAFQETFASFDIETSIAECRAPMGLPKRDHIKVMMAEPAISARIRNIHGRDFGEDDLDALYAHFLSINEDIVLDHIGVIDAVIDMVAWLRDQGIKVGSNSGYGRDLMNRIMPLVAEAGYCPDNVVAGDDLIEGRPGPLMMYRCFADLGVYPPDTVIKVDDTAPGIAEGIAAGTLTVGVTLTGSHVGLSSDALDTVSADQQAALHEAAAKPLFDAGAHHVIRHVAELPDLIRSL
jgi:phosphonoacetaldehyde hydrolase